MAIPDFQSIMLPLLQYAANKTECSLRETVDHLAIQFNLTDEDKKSLLFSGKQTIFDNRVGWARTYLKKAGLLESTKRGYVKITTLGQQTLEHKPKRIDRHYLTQFEDFLSFSNKAKKGELVGVIDDMNQETPEEILEASYQKLKDNLAIELLQTIKACSPAFFERLVIDLIVKMGYGGSRKEAGQAMGGSGDEGIDGMIKEDKLGLDIIYIQAKRWNSTVSRSEIQKFAGALQGQRAKKGIFITTSNFSREALDYVSNIESKIILIDGERLAEFMIDHNVGVSTTAIYELKKLDSDYFSEE